MSNLNLTNQEIIDTLVREFHRQGDNNFCTSKKRAKAFSKTGKLEILCEGIGNHHAGKSLKGLARKLDLKWVEKLYLEQNKKGGN